MKSEIITIGDELLIGQVVNTNQAYIAEQLNRIGIPVDRMTTVGDGIDDILSAFKAAWSRNDVVIVTGGLGPTHDDITKKAVCTFLRTGLVSNDGVRRQIESLLKKRNLSWSPSSEEQTLVPESATILPNPIGSAAGMLFEENNKRFFVLPGVPYEMKAIIDESVIPILARNVVGSVIRHLTLRTTGISESLLSSQLGNIDELIEGATLAFLPSPVGVRLRISVHDRDGATADSRIREIEGRIHSKVEKYIYGTDDEELEEVVGRILREKGLTLAVAESCTGGMIADRITNVSGSSDYFERGVIAYSNKSKTSLLGVPEELIMTHGAVSREVAEAMAVGVSKTAGTDIGLSTTGIAGPTGGTPEKPVGLVWIGYSDKDTALALKFNFGDNRLRTKERATQAALELVRRKILKIQ